MSEDAHKSIRTADTTREADAARLAKYIETAGRIPCDPLTVLAAAPRATVEDYKDALAAVLLTAWRSAECAGPAKLRRTISALLCAVGGNL